LLQVLKKYKYHY